MNTKILLTAPVLLTALSIHRVNAEDLYRSPKIAHWENSLRSEPGPTSDVLDRSMKTSSPKALLLATSLRTVPGVTSNALARNVVTASPKAVFNQPSLMQPLMVAPLR